MYLWVIILQIGNRYKIGLLLLIILFRFMVEYASGLLRNNSLKVFIARIIIAASLVSPKTIIRNTIDGMII